MGYYTSKFAGSGESPLLAKNDLENYMMRHGCKNIIFDDKKNQVSFHYYGHYYCYYIVYDTYETCTSNVIWYAIIY